MKTNKIVNLSFMFVITASTFVACKTSSKTRTNRVAGEKTVNVPCSGSKYFSDKKTFRANAIGESMDQMTSTKKALANARERLASDIEATIKVVGDNYVNSTEFNNKEEVTETFQNMSRTVVNQVLTGTATACEEMKITSENKYKTYIAIELSKDDVLSALNTELSKDEKLKAMYNYEKFKQTFDSEMEKLENGK